MHSISTKAWKRNLAILWISQFFVMAGMSSVVPFLPLFIRELGVTNLHEVAVWSGWAFAAPFISSFLITPVWGAMGDKYGRKLMIVRAIIGLSISLVLLGLSQTVFQLVIFRVFQGLLSGFYPSAMALIAAQAPEGKTGQSLALFQSANISGHIIGPLLGGILADALGYRMVFILSGGITAVLSVLIILYISDSPKTAEPAGNISFTGNIKEFFKTPALLAVGLSIMLAAFAESFLRPIFVLFVESFHLPTAMLSTYTGMLLSINGISAAFSAFYFGRKITSSTVVKGLVIVLIGTGLMEILQAGVPNPHYLFPIRLLLGFFYGLVFPYLFTLVAENASSGNKSGIMGISSSFQTLGNFIGPLLSGYCLPFLGFRGSFVLSGALFILTALLVRPKRVMSFER
ncbi:MAG: MFS transporter [Ignavibacteriales bacterium]|nr:MFS transporter [Ignavibacteriales bacterium]